MDKQPGNMGRSPRRKGVPKFQPGILLSWEQFNDAAMREWLDAVVDEVEQDMDELEKSLRNPN